MIEKLEKMFQNINPNSKMNYEELKKALRLEDYFLDNILEPTANKHGFNVSFEKEYIVFRKEK